MLGLAALGAPAVRSGLWGKGGEELVRINNLAGRLYLGEGKRGRSGLMKACMVSKHSLAVQGAISTGCIDGPPVPFHTVPLPICPVVSDIFVYGPPRKL